ncbi:MAG: NADH-quinone oxidoreductase subunit J [Opitutaceae bacterium]|nr:NADH-quinone oxidoreductase subunit J [Opitutaceae bacterium]
MSIAFLIIALVTLGSAAVAMSLRNLIHSALLLIASWAGIAAFYLWAGAEFVAFAQLLVYVGAVSMVVLFAVLLTRQSRVDMAIAPDALRRIVAALLAGGATLGVLFGAVVSAPLPIAASATPVTVSVRQMGQELMGTHAAALLIVGALLTVALLGAIILASTGREDPPGVAPPAVAPPTRKTS